MAYAAGGLFSTVDDLYRWDQALTTSPPRLVSHASLAQMWTAHATICTSAFLDSFSRLAYGYDWFIGTRFHQRMLYHTGEINGFVAENDFYPDAGVTVIILCNLEHAALPIISADVEKMIFGRA